MFIICYPAYLCCRLDDKLQTMDAIYISTQEKVSVIDYRVKRAAEQYHKSLPL